MRQYQMSQGNKVIAVIEATSPELALEKLISKHPEILGMDSSIINCYEIGKHYELRLDDEQMKQQSEEIRITKIGLAASLTVLDEFKRPYELEAFPSLKDMEQWMTNAMHNLIAVLNIIGGQGLDILYTVNYNTLDTFIHINEWCYTIEELEKPFVKMVNNIDGYCGFSGFIFASVARSLIKEGRFDIVMDAFDNETGRIEFINED